MKNLSSQTLVFGLLLQLTLACGETVNYDVKEQEKSADASGSGTGGGGDAAPGSSPGSESGAESGSDGNQGAGVGSDGVPLACLSGHVLTQKEQLVFPEIPSGTTCRFGADDNLSKKNAFFRAYLRQTQVVNLPAGAILCGFSLEHQPAAMRYDDEMFFSVNDKLLLATKDYSDFFPKTGDFTSFSWDGLKNQAYDPLDSRSVYCVGGAEGLSQCSVPQTETQGNIELKFSDAMNSKLSSVLQNQNKLTFEWITTGDNDDSDCRHTEIDLTLGLSYVMP